MDSITHVLSAALFSEPLKAPETEERATYARWRERFAILLGALAPDADGVLGWMNAELYARYHRVVTHSILGLILIALLCAWLARTWPERWVLPFMRTRHAKDQIIHRPRYLRLFALTGMAAGMHFLGDWITEWGVWPFWPFNMLDCKLSLVNSLEPALLILTVTAWAVQHVFIQRGRRRAAWWIAILWLIAAAVYAVMRPALFGRPFI